MCPYLPPADVRDAPAVDLLCGEADERVGAQGQRNLLAQELPDGPTRGLDSPAIQAQFRIRGLR